MLSVTSLGRDRLRISVRGHEVYSDQPPEDGGEDSAPTPTELFVGAVGACVAFYAERFLRRHGLDAAGLKVTCEYGWAENPHRVGRIDVAVDAPGVPAERREALARVVERCTLHNTLVTPPAVSVRLVAAATEAA